MPGLRAVLGNKFQLADEISGRLATPVLGTHRPNFDVWGPLLPIGLNLVVPRVLDSPVTQTLMVVRSGWGDNDGSALQITGRLGETSVFEPENFFVSSCCRMCKDLDVNICENFKRIILVGPSNRTVPHMISNVVGIDVSQTIASRDRSVANTLYIDSRRKDIIF